MSINRPVHFEKKPEAMADIHAMKMPEGMQKRASRLSRGGRWLCEACLSYQRGSKDAHKKVCTGKVGK